MWRSVILCFVFLCSAGALLPMAGAHAAQRPAPPDPEQVAAHLRAADDFGVGTSRDLVNALRIITQTDRSCRPAEIELVGDALADLVIASARRTREDPSRFDEHFSVQRVFP